jgi:hypothetical protein
MRKRCVYTNLHGDTVDVNTIGILPVTTGFVRNMKRQYVWTWMDLRRLIWNALHGYRYVLRMHLLRVPAEVYKCVHYVYVSSPPK